MHICMCVPPRSLLDQLEVTVCLPPLCAVLWGDDGVCVCVKDGVFVCVYVCLSIYVCVSTCVWVLVCSRGCVRVCVCGTHESVCLSVFVCVSFESTTRTRGE